MLYPYNIPITKITKFKNRLYGPCTTWIVGIKLINDSENEVTNFAKESIEMLSYYTKSLNKGSVMVFSFFVSESEIDQKLVYEF